MSILKLDDLRVWHIPQIPGKSFHVSVSTLAEAKLVLNALARYDLFQLKHHIKPDYCNAQGLEMVEIGDDGDLEWSEWCDASTGNDIGGYEVLA